MKRLALAALLTLAAGTVAAAIDVDALWDHARPEVSEQRFRHALATASGDDALVLRTQIARTLGLRQRFDEAHRELDAIEPSLATAGPQPRVRAWLERGRALRSSGQAAAAEPWFQRAFALADRESLESLAADALHMVALVQPDLADQLSWNRRVVDYARTAKDPAARRWDAVALNNSGVALNQVGRHEEALAVLLDAQAAYERAGRIERVRIARWMVAHTLRRLGRIDEAMRQQLALEAEMAAAGMPDGFVFDELAQLYAVKGNSERAAHYRALAKAAVN